MKLSIKLSRIISFICILVQLFYLINVSSFAQSGINETSETDEITENFNNCSSNNMVNALNTDGSSSSSFTYSIIPPSIALPCSTCISFDNTDIIDYYFVSEGLVVQERENAPMTFDIVADEEFGTFEIIAEKTNGDVINKTPLIS